MGFWGLGVTAETTQKSQPPTLLRAAASPSTTHAPLPLTFFLLFVLLLKVTKDRIPVH